VYDEVIVSGRDSPADEPDWDPLERFLPHELCGLFMWMYALDLDNGQALQAYKHSSTRRYLFLDGDGDAYERLGRGRYRRTRHSDAIEQAFPSPWVFFHAIDDERRALRRAFEAAWHRGNGDATAGAHILPSSPASPFRQLPSAGSRLGAEDA
jgi:hypothetical protein